MEPFTGQNESRPVTDPKIGNRATRLGGSGGPIRPIAYGGSSVRCSYALERLRVYLNEPDAPEDEYVYYPN
jgi:hypothetical protein